MKQAHPEVTLDIPGIYTAELTVKGVQDAQSSKSIELYAGNEPPRVEIDFQGSNRTFFFTDHQVEYTVKVSDREDGSSGQGIAPSQVPAQIDICPTIFI